MAVLFERIAVIGVGLIGGSLGLAARRAGLIREVVGVGRSETNLATALQRGVADRTTRDVARIGPVDLLVLAVPVRSIAEVMQAVVPHLQPGTVVTDVASVKETVVTTAERILPADRPFVGAHPIAGNERAGAAAADPDLFRGARCVITPTDRTDASALERVSLLWQGVGAQVETMAPAEHDRAVAWTSHLVHSLAFSLAHAIGAADDPTLFRLAGPSLRGVTRIAASAPEMWVDIFLTNAQAVTAAIEGLAGELERFRQAIAAGDATALRALLEAARAARARLEPPPQ